MKTMLHGTLTFYNLLWKELHDSIVSIVYWTTKVRSKILVQRPGVRKTFKLSSTPEQLKVMSTTQDTSLIHHAGSNLFILILVVLLAKGLTM